jgi:hypothetical protein
MSTVDIGFTHVSFCFRCYALTAGDEKTRDGPKSDRKGHERIVFPLHQGEHIVNLYGRSII